MYVEFDSAMEKGDVVGINVKVLNGVEWEEVKVQREDCGAEGYAV